MLADQAWRYSTPFRPSPPAVRACKPPSCTGTLPPGAVIGMQILLMGRVEGSDSPSVGACPRSPSPRSPRSCWCVSTIMPRSSTRTTTPRPEHRAGRAFSERDCRVAVAQDRRRRPASPATAITASTPGAGTVPTSMDWLATLSYAQSTNVTRRVGPSSVKRIQP